MIVNLYTYLEKLWCVGPVENACLLREDFKRAKLFALGLYNSYCLVCTIDHKVSWLETY